MMIPHVPQELTQTGKCYQEVTLKVLSQTHQWFHSRLPLVCPASGSSPSPTPNPASSATFSEPGQLPIWHALAVGSGSQPLLLGLNAYATKGRKSIFKKRKSRKKKFSYFSKSQTSSQQGSCPLHYASRIKNRVSFCMRPFQRNLQQNSIFNK